MSTGTQIDVVMPQMGVSVSEGTITKWLKQPGEQVARDEPLLEISTDKVDTEVPSPGEGVLQEIVVPEGETVDVGTVLARIGPAGSEAPAAPAPEAPPASAAPLAGAPACRDTDSPPPLRAPPPQPARRGRGRERQDLRLTCRRAHRLRARRRPVDRSRAPAQAAA